MPDKNPKNSPELNVFIKLSTLGSIIFGLALFGLWLDQKFHTIPLWTVIGIVLGMLYSFFEARQIYKQDK